MADDMIPGMPGVLKTDLGYSLVPGHVAGEGQYCSAVRKTSDIEFRDIKQRQAKPARNAKEMPMPKEAADFVNRAVSLRMKGETVTAVPANIASDVATAEQALHVVAAGCALGTVKGKTLIPDADLALSLMLAENAFPSVEVDRETALKYLHRDTVAFPQAPLGYLLVKYLGLPLGFVKNLGNRCNSLHPQSRRIRMDIH